MPKRSASLLATLALVFALGACGGGSSGSNQVKFLIGNDGKLTASQTYPKSQEVIAVKLNVPDEPDRGSADLVIYNESSRNHTLKFSNATTNPPHTTTHEVAPGKTKMNGLPFGSGTYQVYLNGQETGFTVSFILKTAHPQPREK